MKEAIEKSGEKIILWSADLGFSDLRLEGSKNSSGANVTHSDHELSRALNNVPTARKASIMFLQSHIVTKLKVLITVKEFSNAMYHEKTQKFSLKDLDYYLSKIFFYLDDKTLNSERDFIIKKARELEIIKSNDDIFFISMGPKSVRGQEKELERKWINRKMAMSQRNSTDAKIEELRKKITDEEKKGGLAQYFES